MKNTITASSRTSVRPFDATLSYQLDLVIIALEAANAFERPFQRVKKHWLERNVPAFMPQPKGSAR